MNTKQYNLCLVTGDSITVPVHFQMCGNSEFWSIFVKSQESKEVQLGNDSDLDIELECSVADFMK